MRIYMFKFKKKYCIKQDIFLLQQIMMKATRACY